MFQTETLPGIGRELALLYIKAGCKVGVTGRRSQLLESLQHECLALTEGHPSMIIESFDTMGKQNILYMESLLNKLGKLDLLL